MTKTYQPLEFVTSTTLPTADTAYHLNRAADTIRWWAATGKGPIQPRRVNGRLAWPVADIKRLLGIAPPLATSAPARMHTTGASHALASKPLCALVTTSDGAQAGAREA